MQRIKFKIEYKPLSDESVNRHKNFDALLGLYAATPKLNFFQKLFQNKWIMFTSGIITGGLIASLLIYQYNGTDRSENIIEPSYSPAISSIQNNSADDAPTAASVTDQYTDTNNTDQELITNATDQSDASMQNTVSANTISKSNASKSVDVLENTMAENPSENNDTHFTTEKSGNDEANNKEKEAPVQQYTNEQNAPELPIAFFTHGALKESLVTEEIKSAPNDNRLFPAAVEPAKGTKDKSASNNKEEQSTTVANNNQPENTSAENTTAKNETDPVTTENKANRIIDQIFNNDKTAATNASVSGNRDSMQQERQRKQLAEPDTFIDRYAQVSFITPIGSNGLDSYKYYNHFSLNIIQGYNGAVKGVEVGSVLNLDKGYVMGGQFAGVGNMIAGNLQGIQGAGVINMSRRVTGTQYAGVINFSANGMTGMQGAGVANFTSGKMNGMQAAGVLNISGGINDSSVIFQASGVSNISLSKNSTGLQVAGVVNIANQHTGSQIGLVNVAKEIHGFQIGLVNIADSIDGVAIGLLSISKNGIFDVDVFTSDLFQTNLALRVGGPSVYNVFAFGVSPFTDSLRYGYGLGIGGHIPATPKIAVDIDAMAWSTFEDQFDFTYDYVRLMNQLRVLPSYTFNKYISVYAGPELNVEVYDNDATPFHENTISHIKGPNVTTAFSMGYVVGIRLF